MFFNRLKSLCESRGLNISNFAVEILGASDSLPTTWKKGSSPNSKYVVLSAQYFDVSADYLLGLTDVMRPLEGLQDEDIQLLNAWHKATPVLRDAAMNVLRTSSPKEGETSSPSREAGMPDAL